MINEVYDLVVQLTEEHKISWLYRPDRKVHIAVLNVSSSSFTLTINNNAVFRVRVGSNNELLGTVENANELLDTLVSEKGTDALTVLKDYLEELLEGEQETYPAWVSGVFYPIGAKVSHNGQNWISTVDNNHWEPGSAHSIWEVIL